MPLVLSWTMPDQMSALTFGFLIAVSFATSAMTAAVGLGGGIALIAIMASLMPASALVPVHGMVQLGSNAGRALVQRRYVDWAIAIWFASGAVFGAAVGGAIVVNLPDAGLRIGIACFVFWVVWGKPPKLGHLAKQAMGLAGFVATLLSMFFGAAGPIGAGVLSTLGLTRHQFVANQAVTALIMHICKVFAFGFLGFAFAPWAGLIILMIVSGFIGTLAGTKLLGRMKDETFRIGFKIIMTLLALNLLWQGFSRLIT